MQPVFSDTPLTGFGTLSGVYRVWHLYTREPCHRKGTLWEKLTTLSPVMEANKSPQRGRWRYILSEH